MDRLGSRLGLKPAYVPIPRTRLCWWHRSLVGYSTITTWRYCSRWGYSLDSTVACSLCLTENSSQLELYICMRVVCYLCMNYNRSLVMALLHCASCNKLLVKPYIRCAQCSAPTVELCLCCFSGGFEHNGHKSDHTYEVIVSLHTCLMYCSVKLVNLFWVYMCMRVICYLCICN